MNQKWYPQHLYELKAKSQNLNLYDDQKRNNQTKFLIPDFHMKYNNYPRP